MQKDNSPQVSLNNSINETRQQKQLYLRQQIIQAGYDPEQFISYLNVKLDIHSDLDNCSIKHLEEVVQDFKNKKNRDKQQINSYFFRETAVVQPPICQKSSSVLEPQRILIRPYPQVIQDEYFNKYKCVKVIDKYQKLKGQITCQVKNPQRKYMGGLLGIGGSSFLCFDVSVYGLNKQPVCRRYSDFIWLRNVLTKFCPSFIIPPVPNKKSSKRLPRQIRKRMQILAFFLNDIVKMPTLLNNKYVQGFLLIKDQNKFQSLKQQGEKKKSYQSILSTQTLSGSVQLDLSSQTVKYKQGLNKFVPEVQKLYKQITRNSKKLNSLTVQKINLLYQMSNQFAQLYDISNKFNGFVKSQSTQRLNQIYAMLNNMMAEWGNSLRQEIEYVQKNISTFFKYVRQSFMGFKQLMQKTTNSEQIWIKERQLLEKQKQKIFQLKDTKKWDLNKVQLKNLPKSALYDRNQAFKIMLPKQSVRVNNLKQNYAYYLNQLFEHGNQNLFNSADNFCDNFKQFSIKTKVNNQEIGSMWSQVSYKFSDPYKKSAVILKMQMEKLDESLGQLNGTFQD